MSFDPAQLSALATVLRFGSFEGAARALHVTPSAVSQRIKALEDRVGAALVIRASPCTATPSGARLARHADDIALLDAALLRELALPAAPARLRIAVNADSLATWFLPALAGQDLLYDILLDDESHSAGWLRRGEVSAAITAHGRPVQGCAAVPLGALRYVATCAPDFYARHFSEGVTTLALSRAPVLQFNEKDMLQHDWLRDTTGETLAPPVHRLPSSHGFVDATVSGLGWALNPEPLVTGALRSGALVTLGPHAPRDVALYWQVSRLVAGAISELTQAVRRAAALTLRQRSLIIPGDREQP
ncbi:LysR family transcriptional regulator [Salipiger aestuarii]|uniref:LysR family transcriptional regulator (Chromosome initiation inhibitor) n=1 Tax=Salipiger aestuarii TaxID=568098 RepID=A0A327YAU2_9RHOB|nr:LysR family transcriptional regulator ArgP [Salipiger aestuarii]EIE50879.1 transcriptional regulator [Citreicella sp. 357]KAA8607894.1 LysR family transcriptional regulator [Salipiger aestuarii]KAA8611201.1 LysR family transcriptional regulator [Salipiger aestuarii]KAB2541954.1 LysR family transcriptional regulator [Salipiger aestuarii]RAK18123.1 LysR family transcriptional regulator (chromosome initiation inhibitor) [Salipiger aestuarii]